MKFIHILIIFVFVIMLSFITSFYVMIPRVVESRARNLGFTKYNKEQFLVKDSTYISNYDLYYLKYGSMP